MRTPRISSIRLLLSFLALSCSFAFTGPAVFADSASSMLQPLDQVSPTPTSNCKESKGNNRPADEKGFEADKHEKDSQGGTEDLGTNNTRPPDRAGSQMGTSVQSGQGGPEEHKEKNTKKSSSKQMSALVKGLTNTKCIMISSSGTLIDFKPFLKMDVRVNTVDDTEHNRAMVGNDMVAAGQDLGAEGQVANGSTTPNAQLVPDASQEASIEAVNADNFAQKVPNPRGWSKVAKGVQQSQNAQNADNQGNAAQQNCENAFTQMKVPLINVANEDAASPCSAQQPFKEEANVIWMVQQMYKRCYVQMAILFLLPGAMLTQVKSLVSFGFLGSQDDDTSSPFIGIIRAIVAIFLIPATQLVVSYTIDIGNALTDPVAKRVQVETLMNWVKEQAYATDPKNNDGCIKNTQANMGKLMGTSAASAVQERQNDLNVTVQNMFNTINAMMSQGLEVLNGFQLVMMCYLFLLGPIAAALYAWPAAIGRDLFKRAFANWLDGVIVLSLWKFWWCIILLCMAVRLSSGSVDLTSHYEMYYFTAFMGILVMVPFQPFEFRPGEVVSHVLDKAQKGGGGGGGGGGGSKGGGGGNKGQQAGNPQSGGDSSSTTSGPSSTQTHGQASPGGDGPSGSPGGDKKGGQQDSAKASPDAGNFNTHINLAGDIDLPPMG